MSEIAVNVAVQRLSKKIEEFSWDDIIESHNELFPFQALSVEEEPKEIELVRKKVMDRIENGLEAEEVVDLWNVVFPSDRNVWYDEENECVRFNEEPQQVESSD
ncbi:MAG TPA: hypothetical protein PLY87_23805 [Planctomycetaceae bacterium]|jgi:hypothetical protein|nr:hypothetical protein [Planctomycetaceae bacterium]